MIDIEIESGRGVDVALILHIFVHLDVHTMVPQKRYPRLETRKYDVLYFVFNCPLSV